jgi:hypothetical protein
MSLEGLRAWIGEVERKLGKRTRVFLALAVIAIGLGGAAIYLAIDARESSVSESDVQELQQQLEAQIDASTTGTSTPAEPVEPAPESEPEEPQPKSGQNDQGGGTGGIGTGGASPPGAGAAVPGGASSEAKLQELLEQAKEQNAEAEAEQAGK